MTNVELFIGWNKALFLYFFDAQNNEEDEVSLYIDRDKIDEIGRENELGGYEDFLSIIMLPIEERKTIYDELRRRFITSPRPNSLNSQYNSKNLFDFATIYIDEEFYEQLDCPFLIYIVFAIVMASECYKNNQTGIGNYITDVLKHSFPKHSNRRGGLEKIFFELARKHPQFHADKLTDQVYIGLIKYQLGLTKTQEDAIKKAMYSADLSEDLPYDFWIRRIKDYVEKSMKDLLTKSLKDVVLKRRISDLRDRFDPLLYEQKHIAETIISKGHFVLAIYEDEYSAAEDRLVLLTDINNKSLSHGELKILKGTIDRLGEYAEYNVNHVFIGDSDKAQMKTYSLINGEDEVKSKQLGSIVTFSRCSNNYLIQTDYPQKGKETYILVKSGHEEDWNQWLAKQGSPSVEIESNKSRVVQIFGEGWSMYISKEIGYVGKVQSSTIGTSIIMDGGIKCIGKYKVYLRTALPYFVFPEPIIKEKLKIYMNVESRVLEDYEYTYKIIDNNRLVVDLVKDDIREHSLDVGITLEYKKEKNKVLRFHEDFSVFGQDVSYSEDDLFKLNTWGGTCTNENVPYIKGMKVYNANKERIDMPEGAGFYQNKPVEIDINDHRFYLVNLFTAECSMRQGFSITESKLKKCIRYAATRFDINITSEPTFYRDIKFLLINSGYLNADFEHGKYQPVPPAFIKTAVGINPGKKIFMLVGSYTQKFLYDLKTYCAKKFVSVYLHVINNGISKSEDLMPPVILLGSNFDPHDFVKTTTSCCLYYNNEDVAINLLQELPSYADYDKTLKHVDSSIFSTPLGKPDDPDFPRVRKSKATGYSSSLWIEKQEGDFNQTIIPDSAWAYLYCLYKKQKKFCTKDIDKLTFPIKLHLPVLMQRVLYILNLGIPLKVKAFICDSHDGIGVYYNVVKRYNIKDTNEVTRISSVIRTITGRPDDKQNSSVRPRFSSSRYKLFIWKNKNRASKNPRSLLVLTDWHDKNVYGLGIKQVKDNKESFAIYLKDNKDKDIFKLVNSDDINSVFSKIIMSNWCDSLLNRILSDRKDVFNHIGVEIINDKYMPLPPREEYQIEQIEII